MAILSDEQIWGLIRSGRIKLDPAPLSDAVTTSAIDLRLGNEFKVPRAQAQAAGLWIDTRESTAVMDAIAANYEVRNVANGSYFEMEPGMFALGWTLEQVTLPSYLSARVEGRSTLARVGLSIHQSAPTVHANFNNKLQLELTNASPHTLRLYPGQSICQLILETLSMPSITRLTTIHTLPGAGA